MIKMNAGAWIGIIGGIVGLLVGIIAVLNTTDSMGIPIAAGMLVIFGGMFYLFYRLFFKNMINTNRLQKTGLPGRATILEVRDTGVRINNNPQIKLMLEVKDSLGRKYNTQTRVVVSILNMHQFQPGMEVPVKIDPKNENNVVIDFTGQQQSTVAGRTSYSQADIGNLKTELEELQKEHDQIRLSGKPARAIIKKYTWLGVNVNGNNPYAELELEVLPDLSPSFSAKTKGVIAETSVPKYQPGQEIFVKYDLYDSSKVVIDHS